MKDSFSLSSAMMDNLSDCKVGDEKTLLVPVKVTAYGKDGAEFQITEAPSIEEEPEEPGTAASAPDEGSAEMPPAMTKMMAKRKAYA